MSRKRTFKEAVKSENPIVNISNQTKAGNNKISCELSGFPITKMTIRRKPKETSRLMKFDKMIDIGIASLGNLAFCKRARS